MVKCHKNVPKTSELLQHLPSSFQPTKQPKQNFGTQNKNKGTKPNFDEGRTSQAVSRDSTCNAHSRLFGTKQLK
jgi:hypothetical protein